MKAYVTGCIAMLLPQGNTSVANCATRMPCGGLVFLSSAILLFFDQGCTKQVCVLVVHMN